MSRYEGKPLLRLLELYVLDAIGELSDASAERLVAMEPKLSALYRVEGDWRRILAQVMEFPPTLDDKLRGVWARNQQLAASQGTQLSAEDFARSVVDAQFGGG